MVSQCLVLQNCSLLISMHLFLIKKAFDLAFVLRQNSFKFSGITSLAACFFTCFFIPSYTYDVTVIQQFALRAVPLGVMALVIDNSLMGGDCPCPRRFNKTLPITYPSQRSSRTVDSLIGIDNLAARKLHGLGRSLRRRISIHCPGHPSTSDNEGRYEHQQS